MIKYIRSLIIALSIFTPAKTNGTQCRQEPRNVNNRAMADNKTDFKSKVQILLKSVSLSAIARLLTLRGS